MNNRQKAKHFKNLYEDQLLKLKKPIIHFHPPQYRHYMARRTFDRYIELTDDQMLDLAADFFSREIRDIIRKNIELEKNDRYGQTEASIHVWLEK